MRDDKKLRALVFLGLTFLAFSLFASGFSRDLVLGGRQQQARPSPQAQETLQKEQPQQAKTNQDTEPPEKIVPAFKNIKEQTAAYVFVGWIWVSIIVLIYILGNKIKELDRLAGAKFFDSPHPPDAK